MDYCHPCGRHLNGALACPGCGASAEVPVVSTPAYEGGVDVRSQTDDASGEGGMRTARMRKMSRMPRTASLRGALRGGGVAGGVTVAATVTRRAWVRRARVVAIARPRHIVGGGAGSFSSRRASCSRPVG
ncbi:SCO2400 family protein [Streptomyces sp. L7]